MGKSEIRISKSEGIPKLEIRKPKPSQAQISEAEAWLSVRFLGQTHRMIEMLGVFLVLIWLEFIGFGFRVFFRISAFGIGIYCLLFTT